MAMPWNFWHWSVSDIDHRQIGACCACSKCGTFLFAPLLVIVLWPQYREKIAMLRAIAALHFRIWGWSGGAMVLGKLPVPGRPTNLDNSGARAYCACSRCGRGLFGHFFSRLSLLFFILPIFGRRLDIDWNTVSKGR